MKRLVRWCGLDFESNEPVPGPVADPDEGCADVSISVTRHLPPDHLGTPYFFADDHRIEWFLPGLFRAGVHGGGSISLDTVPSVGHGRTYRWLAGPLLAAVLAQRGRLPLHASAVVRTGRVTAFVGESGAGKTTMMQRCADDGWHPWADDLAAVQCQEGACVVDHGPAFIKSWSSPEVIEPLELPADRRACALGAVVILQLANHGPRVTSLRGGDALTALRPHVHLFAATKRSRTARAQLEAMAALVNTVPVFLLEHGGVGEEWPAVRELLRRVLAQ